MSGISNKRELVLRAYPHSPTWPAKVRSMTDSQLIAVFFSLVKKGKIQT
jgi:hypothetical protein